MDRPGNARRSDPFALVRSMPRDFERLAPTQTAPSVFPAVDAWQDEDGVAIIAELPAVGPAETISPTGATSCHLRRTEGGLLTPACVLVVVDPKTVRRERPHNIPEIREAIQEIAAVRRVRLSADRTALGRRGMLMTAKKLLSRCRFRGREFQIVTKEVQSGYDETNVQS